MKRGYCFFHKVQIIVRVLQFYLKGMWIMKLSSVTLIKMVNILLWMSIFKIKECYWSMCMPHILTNQMIRLNFGIN